MKKRWIAVILCLLLLLAASACGKEEDGPDSLLNNSTTKTEQSTSDSQNSSDDSDTEEDSTDSKESAGSKDNSKKDSTSGSTSSVKGKLTEKKALKLVFEQAEEDYGGGSVYVKETSGEILDQNDTAYIVGFEICTKGHEENNFTEAYWINKKTKEIRDVCGVNEYFEGMIDITNGTALF